MDVSETVKENVMYFQMICMSGLMLALGATGCSDAATSVQRPEKIVSKREVLYDTETYRKLAILWKDYHSAYPSEDAYANWMYAARYAEDKEYVSLLKKGLEKYPANPTLLYLFAMLHHGSADNIEAQALLMRATKLDPSYMDPWFALVIHSMEKDDRESTNLALRRLLDGGAVQNEIMDYSYNMMAVLEKDAILITNGDNDTYPGWILSRVLQHRPDVTIVNRSLLNTTWYPLIVQKDGVPNFIASDELEKLSSRGESMSDSLVERLVEAARRADRPVYVSATVGYSATIDGLRGNGRDLGLVTLVTPAKEPHSKQLRAVLTTWSGSFRTTGIETWEFRYAKSSRAGRQLVLNYTRAMRALMEVMRRETPDLLLSMFRWYRDHMTPILPGRELEEMNRAWCESGHIEEIRGWCEKFSYITR